VTLWAQALTKRYGGAGHKAVHGASLELQAGEFISIVGRSGSGKSTLMAMLGALTRPTEGQVLFEGTDIWTLPETQLAEFRCRHVGFIFQFPSLLANLTALDNVAVPALLGRTMSAEAAYARAYELLARVGLADRSEAFPGSLSGGEQRRVVVARALINSPRIVLADEPTSDLDEDSEADIIDLFEELQQDEQFGLILVTHNLNLARRAQRIYEMRQGALVTSELPVGTVENGRSRYFEPVPLQSHRDAAEAAAACAPSRLGSNLLADAATYLLTAAAVFGAVLLGYISVGKYQDRQLRAEAARIGQLQYFALNGLRGDVQSVSDLGEGRYELTTYLQNVGNGSAIYVMSPDMRAYVQVGSVWREIPLKAIEMTPSGVTRIVDRQTYRYEFDARVRNFTQLLPNYMHVRFSGTMLISPSSVPKDDVFERKDNYYVYLKPFDVTDESVQKRMRFSGRPPVWIPMPPH